MTVEIDRIVRLVKESRNSVAFTGAGISTASGIPDFRSPTSGLWEGVEPYEVASLSAFRRNPKAFYDWVYPLVQQTLDAQPNAAHMALVSLEKYASLKAIITQNIDMLHTRAGNKTVYELHGHLRQATCTHCFRVYDAAPIITRFLQDHRVPHCETCRGVIKPNVILFGEQLPVRELNAARDAAKQADLLWIIGSSLEVAPASDIPVIASRYGAKLIIVNLESTPADSMASVIIRANAADVLPEVVRRLEASV